jgi:two-component system OmpR family sensor kinase
VAILVVTAVGLAGSGAASFLVQRSRALSTVDAQLSSTVPALKAIAAGTPSSSPLTSVDAVMRASMRQIVPTANESVLGFIDYKPALIPAANLPFRMDNDPAFIKRVVGEANATNVVLGTAKSSAGTLRYLIVPVTVAGDTHIGHYLAAYNLDAVLADVAQSFQAFVFVALIALVLVGLVAWFVAGRLLRPIRLLRESAAANSGANLSARIPVTGHDDVSELTATINGMFERLENAFNSQRRLIDDVRHELKTPITIIRGNLELLDMESPDDIAATRLLAMDELDRMGRLVSELSLLAESSTPDFVEPGEVDIGALTVSVEAKARALDLRREWSVGATTSGTWVLDRERITQAWLQLADNAAKYSTADAPIVIGSDIADTRSGTILRLWVQDAGPGIPVQAQDRIFERFGRLEPQRGPGGSGLGLAIVMAIAEAHGGTVQLDSDRGQGSRFTIQLPVRVVQIRHDAALTTTPGY